MSLNGAYLLALQGLEEAITDRMRVIEKRMDAIQHEHCEWMDLNHEVHQQRLHLEEVKRRILYAKPAVPSQSD